MMVFLGRHLNFSISYSVSCGADVYGEMRKRVPAAIMITSVVNRS
jgi:hypothetical protein